MKALLIKDMYTIVKMLKLYLGLIIILAAIPGFSSTGFAVIYAGLLPISVLSYDERLKWDKLAAMMPFSDRDIVVSKYVLGYILLAASAVVSYIGSLAAAAFMRETVSAELFSQLIQICAIGIILMSVNMPLMFKMGVEKARLLFIISVGFVIAAVSFSQRVYESAEVSNVEIGSISLPLFFAAVAVSLVSMVISVSIYKRKEH